MSVFRVGSLSPGGLFHDDADRVGLDAQGGGGAVVNLCLAGPGERGRLRSRLQAIRIALSDQPFQTGTSDVAEPLYPSVLDEPPF